MLIVSFRMLLSGTINGVSQQDRFVDIEVVHLNSHIMSAASNTNWQKRWDDRLPNKVYIEARKTLEWLKVNRQFVINYTLIDGAKMLDETANALLKICECCKRYPYSTVHVVEFEKQGEDK